MSAAGASSSGLGLPIVDPDIVSGLSQEDQEVYYWWHAGKTDSQINESYNALFNKKVQVRTTSIRLRKLKDRLQQILEEGRRDKPQPSSDKRDHEEKGNKNSDSIEDSESENFETMSEGRGRRAARKRAGDLPSVRPTASRKRKAKEDLAEGTATKIPRRAAASKIAKQQSILDSPLTSQSDSIPHEDDAHENGPSEGLPGWSRKPTVIEYTTVGGIWAKDKKVSGVQKASRAVPAETPFVDPLTSYFQYTQNRLPSINWDHDPNPADVEYELSRIHSRTRQLMSKQFGHLGDQRTAHKIAEENFFRMAAHLTMTLRDAAVLISGAETNTADALRDCMNPSSGQTKCTMSQVPKAFFWAIMTLRVFRPDLLRKFQVPGSQEPDSEMARSLKGFYEYLESKSSHASIMWRYQWKAHRAEHLKTPGFKAKVEEHSEGVLCEYESGICALFEDEERKFPAQLRLELLGHIQDAIVIKCRADLAHYKCEWRWPAMGAFYNEDTMYPKVVGGHIDGLPNRTLNRVRFATTPALMCRVPNDEYNFEGLERWETELRHAETPASEQQGDGWFNRETATWPSHVVMLDGPLNPPGPKWTEE